jgi:glycosyltransferase involved in cell wall biosynthesis
LGAAWFDSVGVYRLIRQSRLDVFHGPSFILPFRKPPGVRYVLTVHDLAMWKVPQHYSAPLLGYYRWRVPPSVALADSIMVISKSTKRDLVSLLGVAPELVHVVYPGVKPVFQTGQPHSTQPMVAEPYFFSVCTHRRKNMDGALEAFAQLVAERKDTRTILVIAGSLSPDHVRELEQTAQRLGVSARLKLLGYVTDEELADLYRRAIASLYPSLYEGFGLPVVESMACDCPVITSDVSSMPELLPDGEWLVDFNSTEAIKQKMATLVDLSKAQRAELIRRNREFSRQFTWENAAKQTLDVLTGQV